MPVPKTRRYKYPYKLSLKVFRCDENGKALPGRPDDIGQYKIRNQEEAEMKQAS